MNRGAWKLSIRVPDMAVQSHVRAVRPHGVPKFWGAEILGLVIFVGSVFSVFAVGPAGLVCSPEWPPKLSPGQGLLPIN